MLIDIAGLPVELTRKNVKHLRLSVVPPDGAVRVSAPYSLSEARIIAFVQSKRAWIERHQAQMQNSPARPPRQPGVGNILSVWGVPYRLEPTESRGSYALILNGENALFSVRPQSTDAQRLAWLNEWYRGLLKQQIAKILPQWERRTGLYCSGWQTKNMTSRWGTCNTATGKIWLNLHLAKKPPQCLEYVILHELAHLRVRNHGRDFQAIMDSYMPDWRERRKRLNEYGLDDQP